MIFIKNNDAFIIGIKDKYPVPLLKGRVETEGNVVSCFFKDMLLLDETSFTPENFITQDGRFYFELVNHLRNKGFYSLDEVTILSNCNESVIERYEALDGWDTIQHQIDIINIQNFDVYADTLYRENIILKLHDDGFNLLKEVDIGSNKKIIPLKLFRKLTAEQVTDWYESRMATYGTGYSSKILEEEEIDFDDEFFDNCAEGLENGVPFDMAGYDINGEEMNCFPFLSRQANGLLEGTLTVMAGYSGTGKSTWYVTLIMALLYRDRKILIISNEENIKKFKIKFLVWMLGKRNRYYGLSKKKLMSGDMTDEDKKQLKDIQKYWRDNYKGRLKFVAIADANLSLVKKKIRENVLRYGYDTVLYDTLKLDFSTAGDTRQDLALIKDTRDLDTMAKKYNIIMLASLQLAIHTMGKLFLDSSTLSTAKQSKEVMENLFLMRSVYPEELDPNNKKYYCRPFRHRKVGDKWIEEEYQPDTTAVWKMVFIDKLRSGSTTTDDGIAYLMKFSGDYATFRETCKCRPKHGMIT